MACYWARSWSKLLILEEKTSLAILLSEKGFAMNQLGAIFEIDRDSISQRLD